MKHLRIICGCFLVIFFTGSCIGCGNTSQPVESPDSYVEVVNMESAPVIEYTVPQLLPNIFVNQKGYFSGSEKEATIKGKELPSLFQVFDANTEEVVYSGTIEGVSFNEELNLYTGVAVFSGITKEGNYYLECDKIGQSYTFAIKNDIFQQHFSEVYEVMLRECKEQTIDMKDVRMLLTAYEWYPTAFPDEDNNQIPDVLEVLEGWITVLEQSQPDKAHDLMLLALMAKFGYLYQDFDAQFATECIQHASEIFSKLQEDLTKEPDYFYALTELYRATGLHTYRNQIVAYAPFFQEENNYIEEPSYLYGAMTYMVTRQRVDINLCNTFMDDIMDGGEEVSNQYEDMIHPIEAKNNGEEELLTEVQKVCCCNYVLNNYQYTRIIEEFLDYLMGKNMEAICFYPGEETQSSYLLLLSQLIATLDKR